MIRRFVTLVNGVSTAFGVVSAILLAAAMLIAVEMIFLRYVFRAPTIWQTDFVVYSATAAVFLGAPYVLLTRGHVGIDVVEMRVRHGTRRALRLVATLLGLAFCAAMLVASVQFFREVWSEEWLTPGIWKIPLWIPMLPLPIGFGLLCLQYLAEMLQLEIFRPAREER